MSTNSIIPPNVAPLLPPYIKELFGYQPLPKQSYNTVNTYIQNPKRAARFNLWRPNRMPVFMPICLCIIVFLSVTFLVYYKFRNSKYQTENGGICKKPGLFKRRNIAFVFAHPDDEVMFFAPSILSISSMESVNVFFVCLSNGNGEGLGATRQKELIASGIALGVVAENIHVIDHLELPDGMDKHWNEKLISDQLFEFVNNFKIEAVITFDEFGVSGHVNHMSVYNGVRYLLQRADLPTDFTAYKLITTGVLRKYSSILDLIHSYFGCDVMFVNSLTARSKAVEAMKKHESQWVWFRKLYMLLSRYMFINTLSEIQTSEKKTS